MALPPDPAHELRILPGPVADHEEGGPHTGGGQQVENLRGPLGMWAVVEKRRGCAIGYCGLSRFVGRCAAHETEIGKEALSTITEEKVLYERTGATLKPMGQLKVILTSIRKKELTPAQYKDAALKGYAKVESKMLMDSGILKIVGSFATAGEKKQGFDSMLELYFASADELKAAFGSPLIGALRKDEEAIVDLDAPEIRMVAEEFVL